MLLEDTVLASSATTDADEHEQLQRPGWACVLCPPPRQAGAWRQADSNFVTCSPCDQQLRERLDDIAARYVQLDTRPGATGQYGSRGAPGFSSRPPCNLHIVALQDPRSSSDAKVWLGRDGRVHRESQRPPLSVYGTLSCQAWAIAEHRAETSGNEVAGPGDRDDVWGLLRFLSRHVGYLTRYAELTLELDHAVRDLLAQLRPVTGDARRKIGTCPAGIEAGCAYCGCASAQHSNDDAARPCNVAHCGCPGFSAPVDADPVRCDAPLHAPMNGSDTITCGACGTRWERSDWLRLGDLLMHAEEATSVA